MTKKKNKLEILNKNPEELKEYSKNPKEHPKEQINNLAISIQQFGFKVPILITKDNEIVAGHGRLMAAKQLKLKTIPCIVADDLSEAEIKAFRIADNKLAKTEWELDFLKEEMIDLKEMNFDITTTGFNSKEIDFFMSLDKDSKNDPYDEYKDMPEYISNDKTAYRTIYLHFMSEEDVRKFSKLINQKISEKTKYLYFPKQEHESIGYDNES